MFSTLKRVFDRRSTAEKLIDETPESTILCTAPAGTLDRRVVPTLIVKHHPDSRGRVNASNLRLATVCIEHRLMQNYPGIAENIDMYNWEGTDHGPASSDQWRDIRRMSTTDWSQTYPVGAKKDWSYGGDFKPGFYAIDSTDRFLDSWFNHADMSREIIETVVTSFLDEHTYNGEYLAHFDMLEEALGYRQSFFEACIHY